MLVTQNRLDLMETVTVAGVQEKDPLTVDFREFDITRTASQHQTLQSEGSRPDLIAQQEYASAGFWWFILAVNGVVDPWDLLRGEFLKVPNLLDYYDWFRQQKGE